MFAISIRYLLGRAVATHPSSYDKAEWPPHPDRLFMALVATWGETGRAPAKESALRWLESQPPPSLYTSLDDKAIRRDVTTVFVPVNDNTMPKLKDEPSDDQISEGLALLPGSRGKQARFFPAVRPMDDVTKFIWHADLPEDHLAALAALCRDVVRLGHSSSLVQCWLEGIDEVPSPDQHRRLLSPAPNALGGDRLRVPHDGRLDELERLFASNLRPTVARWMHYEEVTKVSPDEVARTIFSEHLVVLRQVGGRRFGLEATAQVANALRDTLMALCPMQPAPEWLSGHRAQGLPSEQPHLAFLPLANVGNKNADGRLLGFALALPNSLASTSALREILYDPLGEPKTIRLVFGNLGEMHLEVANAAASQITLQSQTWTRPSRRWATVTPIAFDRHPKGRDPWAEIEAAIILGCERVGLKDLVHSVAVTPVSPFLGAPTNRGFPNLQRKSGGNIHHSHAVITFKEPVTGPLMIGAGRFRGYGFCRPLKKEDWA
ncbi:type I-U CRISPR-associated protein Csb2 [Verrucomicrobium sp. BvORR034]|uniref:type I-G CRISPR-associated protein Csb2 n=1 Tax=Verrucomicrobium sp. BvORR034 TaxID=1396418 RepID=UPI00067861E4|nr:type I-U CRISPR-associated protein Csb2 [Verrucomicrobium sp. BvORR034]